MACSKEPGIMYLSRMNNSQSSTGFPCLTLGTQRRKFMTLCQGGSGMLERNDLWGTGGGIDYN
jgi:hypothetical protein